MRTLQWGAFAASDFDYVHSDRKEEILKLLIQYGAGHRENASARQRIEAFAKALATSRSSQLTSSRDWWHSICGSGSRGLILSCAVAGGAADTLLELNVSGNNLIALPAGFQASACRYCGADNIIVAMLPPQNT